MDTFVAIGKRHTVVIRERFWHAVIVVAALAALVVGSIGIVSQSAQSFPAMMQAAASELGGGEQDGQVESADEVARMPNGCTKIPGGPTICCFDFLYGSQVCYIKAGSPTLSAQVTPEDLNPITPVVSNLQAFSSEPVPGGGRPSASNQPFTPDSRL